MAKEAKKKTWCKFRHRVITALVKAVLPVYCIARYRIRVEPFRSQGKRPYLILLNHQTPFDQFFVGMAFRGPVYYMATEDIFSMGWVSNLIRYVVAPIPIRKQTTDIQAVMNCLRIAREGGTICIAPEGNRTYSGRTEYMNPAIGGLIKKLGLPVALFRIEGGYGVEPRWSDVTRRGAMKAGVVDVIEREEAEALSREEIIDRGRRGLQVNEDCVSGTFRHKKLAEYLERAIYVCPYCGLAEHYSEKDLITCRSCGRQVRYLPTKELRGVGFDFPFPFVAQWYDYQKEFVNGLDLTAMTQAPLFRDRARLIQVHLYERKELLRGDAAFCLYGDRVTIDEGTAEELVIPFGEISAATALGRNKLNLYVDKKVYQVKGGKRFNALKYVNFVYRYKNIIKGEENGKFLGL